jgi:hypothetical protein
MTPDHAADRLAYALAAASQRLSPPVGDASQALWSANERKSARDQGRALLEALGRCESPESAGKALDDVMPGAVGVLRAKPLAAVAAFRDAWESFEKATAEERQAKTALVAKKTWASWSGLPSVSADKDVPDPMETLGERFSSAAEALGRAVWARLGRKPKAGPAPADPDEDPDDAMFREIEEKIAAEKHKSESDWARWASLDPASPQSERLENLADARQAQVAQRFSLHSFDVQGALALTPAQRVAVIDRAERALLRACEVIGCDPRDFGMGQRVEVEAASPFFFPSKDQPSVNGHCHPQERGEGARVRIVIAPDSLDAEATWAHEWAHGLDFVVGAQTDPTRWTYFSNLPDAVRRLRDPQAAEGCEKVFAALGSKDGLEGSRLAIAELERGQDRLAANLAASLLPLDVEPKARERLAEAFGNAEIVAAIALAGLSKTRERPDSALNAFLRIARGRDDQLAGDASGGARRLMLQSLAEARGLGWPVPVEQAEQLARDLAQAFGEQRPLLDRLASASHASAQFTQIFWAGDSVFAKASEGLDRSAALNRKEGAAFDVEAYWTMPTEAFARGVGRRLVSADSYAGQLNSPGATPPLDTKAFALFRDGLADMAERVGVKLRRELSAGERAQAGWVESPDGQKSIQRAVESLDQSLFLGRMHAQRLREKRIGTTIAVDPAKTSAPRTP